MKAVYAVRPPFEQCASARRECSKGRNPANIFWRAKSWCKNLTFPTYTFKKGFYLTLAQSVVCGLVGGRKVHEKKCAFVRCKVALLHSAPSSSLGFYPYSATVSHAQNWRKALALPPEKRDLTFDAKLSRCPGLFWWRIFHGGKAMTPLPLYFLASLFALRVYSTRNAKVRGFLIF